MTWAKESDSETDSIESSSEYAISDHEPEEESDGERPGNETTDVSATESSASDDEPAEDIVISPANAAEGIPGSSTADDPVPQLYDGNLQPVSFYQGVMQSFNKDDCLRKTYGEKQTNSMNAQLLEWREYVLSPVVGNVIPLYSY